MKYLKKEREPVTDVHVRIKSYLHDLVKDYADRKDLSMNAVFNEILSHFFGNQERHDRH